MQRNMIAVALLVSIISHGFAQDSEPAIAKEVQSEVRFNVVEQPVQIPMFRPDPEVLEQKFVASIRFDLIQDSQFRSRVALNPAWRRSTLKGQSFLTPEIRSHRFHYSQKTVSELCQSLLESIPDEVLPSDEDLEFFLSEESSDFVRFGFSRRASTITILAPTEELAEARARTFIALTQAGIADPIREQFRKERDVRAAGIEKTKTKNEQLRQTQSETKKQLEGLADIGGEELLQLKMQRRQVDVDLAASKAQIKEIYQIRRGKDDPAQEKLADMMVTLRIEAAGLDARKHALDALIETGEERSKLEAKRRALSSDIANSRNRMNGPVRTLNQIAEFLALSKSLCVPQDNEVTIAPIKWTK